MNKCTLCQRMKSGTLRPAGLLQSRPIPPESEKAKRWVLDYAVKLPRTALGNDSILVMVSRNGKYTLISACNHEHPAAESIRTITDATAPLCKPFSLTVDSDSRFRSTEFRQWASNIDCELHIASVDHHETVGLAERGIQTIKQLLRFYVNSQQTDRDEYLTAAQSAMNDAHCTALGCSPSYLMYGMDPTTPRQGRAPVTLQSQRSVWQRVAGASRGYMELAQRRMTAHANAKRRNLSFQVGNLVLLNTKHPWFATLDGVRRLLPRWVGPFKVIEVPQRTTCTLQLPRDMGCDPDFHFSLLKHYHPDTRRLEAPLPVEVDGHEEYEVDAILAQQVKPRTGKREYRVSFKGYGPHRNLWLPEENLEHCTQAIEEYKRRVQALVGVRAIRERRHVT